MKNISRYLLLSSVLLLLTSCEDFLDLAPVTQITTDKFYRNAEEMESAVSSVYSGFTSRGYESGRTVLFIVGSDNSQWNSIDANANNEISDFDRFNIDAGMAGPFGSLSVLETFFRNAFVVIYRANEVIDRVSGAEADQATKDRIEAEAKFLRAYAYFDLVRVYGELPISLDNPGSRDQAFLPLSSAADVYSQVIIPDLQFAIANLPLQSAVSAGGRASKGAAQSLLAKVYLTQGSKGEAASLLREVVSSGEYALVPSFEELWNPDNKNSTEAVFELQYVSGVRGGFLAEDYMPLSMRDVFWDGLSAGASSQVLVTQDLINDFEAGDTRFDGTLRLGADINGDGAIDDATSGGAREEVPHQRKYRQPSTAGILNNSENTLRLRYADVLLMLAEALDGNGESWDLIDQVRSRAGLAAIDRGGNFTDALAHERRVEFAFEGHRWHDLRRLYGDDGAANILQAQLARQGESVTISGSDLVRPIHSNEADLNGW